MALSLALALTVACGGDGTPTAAETLALSGEAVRDAGGYGVAVTGENLVLPRWGGVDSGAVSVDPATSTVSAELHRTGDGKYLMLFAGGETVFKRDSCDHFARVPGGGAEVLKSFLWNGSGILGSLSEIEYAVGAGKERTVILAEEASLGPVQIELDRETLLPIQVQIAGSGDRGHSEWQFGEWGTGTTVTVGLGGTLGEQGPGGNPC